jgi:hypothetical protein
VFSVDANSENFENEQKTTIFPSFFKKEIDEVSHRAICSQVYDFQFNSAYLAKKNFEFAQFVQSQQIVM